MAKGSNKKKSNSSQEARTNNGNIYQAGGDITINESGGDIKINESDNKPQEKTKWLSNTQTVFAIAGSIVAIIIGLFTIREKSCNPQKSDIIKNDSVGKKTTLLITGIIRDRATKKGISNAYITSEFTLKDTVATTSDGTFQFEASGDVGQSIRIYVQADNYQPRNEYHTLGLPMDIELDKR